MNKETRQCKACGYEYVCHNPYRMDIKGACPSCKVVITIATGLPESPILEEKKVKESKSDEFWGCVILLVILIGFCLGVFYAIKGIISWISEPPKIEKKVEKKEAPKLKPPYSEKYFSIWDGSHSQFVKEVKERIKSPSSFKHLKTTIYLDPNDKEIMYITMDFEAQNSFGASLRSFAYVKAYRDNSQIIKNTLVIE